jgi:hypothetical protein
MKKDRTVTVALIGAGALIIAAVLGGVLQHPSWLKPGPRGSLEPVIAGTVVDESSNQAVGQALLSIVGRAETYVTEDNGNFRIELQGTLPENGRVRLHVTKSGYSSYDKTVAPPNESLIIPLKKL